MCPDRWRRITGRTARVMLTTPYRLVSTCARNSSSGKSSIEPLVA